MNVCRVLIERISKEKDIQEQIVIAVNAADFMDCLDCLIFVKDLQKKSVLFFLWLVAFVPQCTIIRKHIALIYCV